MSRESAAALFAKLSPAAQDKVRELYGDNLQLWESEYWRRREQRLLRKAKKLSEMGVDVKGLTELMLGTLRRKLGGAIKEEDI